MQKGGYKEYLQKIAEIEQDKKGMFTSPDILDKQQYIWQVSGILWLADVDLNEYDTIFGKLLQEMPQVSISIKIFNEIILL